MLIDINKVVVKDRIRKDYGNIEELADDIKKNGLINPPVVTPDFELIAGERRLKAMEHLGYNQIEVRVMKVNDFEHMLNLEINENESRKDFTKSERINYAKQLHRIEEIKAKKRQLAGGTQNFAEGETGEVTDKVAKKLNIGSGEQYRKEKYIAENADEETLNKWDKEEISTHKAYTRIKELEKTIKELQEKEPSVIEVVPEHIKEKLQQLENDKKELNNLKNAGLSIKEYNKQKLKIDQQVRDRRKEYESLMNTMRRLEESYDKKNERLTVQANLLNKIRMAVKPLKQLNSEIQRLFEVTGELDAISMKEVNSEVDTAYKVLNNIEEQLKIIRVEEVYYEKQ